MTGSSPFSLREQFVRLWLAMWRLGGPGAMLVYRLSGELDDKVRWEMDRLDRERGCGN